jgi:hypothetical protein
MSKGKVVVILFAVASIGYGIFDFIKNQGLFELLAFMFIGLSILAIAGFAIRLSNEAKA